MEFPIPSEIQAYLEGKINEKELDNIYQKRQMLGGVEGEGEGDQDSSEEEKGEEEHMNQSQSQNLSENEMKKLVKGEFIMNGSDDNIDSDSDQESQYDIEGEEDVIPELASLDYREYKYGITKKLLFAHDEEEELKNMRYIFKELLLDIGIGRFTIGSALTSIIIMFLAIWLRMYIHYLFQYIFLKLIDVPVSETKIMLYRIVIDYGFWNVYQEVISVMSGPFGCTLFFSILIFLTYLGHQYVEFFPKVFSKFVVWFGFGSMGDGILIAIVDTAIRNKEGDFYKLPNYYEKAEDSPIAGYIVVTVIYIFFIILNVIIFYNYIIYLHMNGKLQDIYARLSGDPKVFFIPHDNEISLRHLLWAYHTAITNSQRIVVNQINVFNDYGEPGKVTTLQTSIYKTKSSLEISRTFIRDEIGCVRELTENEISYCNARDNLDLIKFFDQVPTKAGKDFHDRIEGIDEHLNLAVRDIEKANPNINKYVEPERDRQMKSDRSFNRKMSMPRRMASARSNKSILHRAETARSRAIARRSSIRSKKSIMTPTSKRGKRKTLFKRKKTVKDMGDSNVDMKRHKSHFQSKADLRNSDLSKDSMKFL